MSSTTMILWKLIEILLKSPRAWSRLTKGFDVSVESGHQPLHRLIREADLAMEKKKSALGSSFRRKLGFRRVDKVTWQSTSGSPSFILSCLQ